MPDEKIFGRYSRVLDNFERSIPVVDEVRLFDNSDAEAPYRLVARFEGGALVERAKSVPAWAKRFVGDG